MAPYLLNQHDEGGRTLIEAIETANERIYEISKRSEATRGMGTTITAAFIKDYQAYIANVGDSRTYLIRRNKIYRVTKDHSLVQEMIDKGKLTEEQAHHHPNRNVITRVVGYKEKIMVDIFNLELQSGDSLLLCTDGLHSRVMDYEMLTIVNRYHDPNKACHELVKLAKKRMASDNISVILIRL
jgi:protein phosphatase